MPWDVGQNKFIRTNDVGSTGVTVWQDDKNATPTPIKIRADRHDYHDQDIADGISACLNLDGVTTMRAALPMGNNKITTLAAGALATDAAAFGQVFSTMSFDEPSRTLTLGRTTGADLTAVIPDSGGAGSGTVTSIDIGEGLSGVSDPITTTGDIKLETIGTLQTFSGGISSVTVDKHGRVTQVIEGAFANTNLGVGTRSGTQLEITSSTGTNVFVPLANTSQAGLMSANDKTTLDGLSSGGVPAILSNGTTPSLNTGITATEVRNLIGAGTGDGDGDITSVEIIAGNGLTGGGIDTSGPVSLTLTMGVPGTLNTSSTNQATAESHTHSITGFAALTGAAFTGGITGTTADFTGEVEAASFNVQSARHLKDEVTGTIDADAIHLLRPILYTMKSDPDQKVQYGYFADEVEQAYPEMVRHKDGEAASVDYARLVVPAIEKLKQLEARMEAAGL